MVVRRTKEFAAWLRRLSDKTSRGRIDLRIRRLEIDGHFGVTRSVGGAIREMKLDFGPGFRLYYIERDDTLVFLLMGGDKHSQRKDIEHAHQILRRIDQLGETDAIDDLV